MWLFLWRLLYEVCHISSKLLILLLKWKPNIKTTPGECVLAVLKAYNLPSHFKTKDIILHCLHQNLPLYFFRGKQNHIQIVTTKQNQYWSARVSGFSLFEIVLSLNLLGEAQTSKRRESKTNATTTKNLPTTSIRLFLSSLKEVLSVPMMNSYFGLNDKYELDFGDSSITIQESAELAEFQSFYSATIICNSSKQKQMIFKHIMNEFQSKLRCLAITKVDQNEQENAIYCEREKLNKIRNELASFELILIDEPDLFNLRSKYAEILQEHSNPRYIILLYAQQATINYMQLSGIRKLETIVPEIVGNWGYFRNNVIKLEEEKKDDDDDNGIENIQIYDLPNLPLYYHQVEESKKSSSTSTSITKSVSIATEVRSLKRKMEKLQTRLEVFID